MANADWRAKLLLQPVTGMRLVASAMIGAAALAGVAVSWSNWDAYYLAVAFLEDGSASMGDVIAADERSVAAFWWSFAVIVAAGVAFIVWLVRVRENAERLCHAEHSLGKGWAIGAWFVPVVNLWFPYQVVRDVWKASKPGAGGLRTLRGVPGSPVVALWWGLWVLAIVVDRLGFIGEPETVDDFHTLCVVLTAVAVLKVAAAVVVVRVMAEISGWQERARKDA